MEIKAEKITSEQAKEMIVKAGLEDYKDDKKIKKYRDLMLKGKWSLFYNRTSKKFINDPIIFLESGRLFEGKHRMKALSKTKGLELDFWVLRGLNKEQQKIFKKWHDDWKLTKAWKN